MNTLLRLFIRNGGFLTFVLLEVGCFFLIVQNNEEQERIFIHSYGRMVTKMLERERRLLDYFSLDSKAERLQEENARLLTLSTNAQQVQIPGVDTMTVVLYDSLVTNDSLRRRLVRPYYEYIPAQAVSNTIHAANNWLIVNRGSNDGLRKNTGVIAPNGLVGVVWHVDPDFSLVMSLLHRQTRVSAALKREGSFGSLVWDGADPAVMILKDIAKHVAVNTGDSVVTSGLSEMFPRNIFIGTVEGEPKQDPENPYFRIARVRLNHDMSKTNEVYVVKNFFGEALERLKRQVRDE